MSHHLPSKHIICVGAVYIDTVLTVPHFPQEDTKLRAKKLMRRRGGNTANTLEVLAQLLENDPAPLLQPPQGVEDPGTWLHLISVLPHHASPACCFIMDSLPHVDLGESSIFRHEHEDAAASYIIQSQETLSRTIVSVNELPEMTLDEFKIRINTLSHRSSDKGIPQFWIHFEGRVPDITLECVRFLRHEHPEHKISVECEKPERSGMIEVATFANAVFYSKLWVETHGFGEARTFLEAQLGDTREEAILCCTWGAGGATAVQKNMVGENQWAAVDAWKPHEGDRRQVVDTIGAGGMP